jgi:2-methylisocitrate lyase-like PEP mutase family enzyme
MPDDTRATRFRALHAKLFLLPNAWDAGSARLVESLGAEAVATTSSGVAWAHGYPDGDALPIGIHAAAIGEIARAVDVPISVDAEGGYSSDPKVVGENISRLIDAGAVGINLEDGRASPDETCAKIEAAKTAGVRSGVDLFVNCRTDVILRGLAPGREVDEILRRRALYAAAGGDGLFAPGVTDAAWIERLAENSPVPLNVMAMPGLPPPADLAKLGVRRLSAGAAIAQKTWAMARTLASQFLAEGATPELFSGAMGYSDLNALMQR